MSRQIPSMPPEEDRHMMIYSQGNLESPRPEPPSRSPSPDLPPNFVPKPPVESSSFPAANNIISLLTRMSGGASLRDLIIVPAATWDRNNTMWEHKMTQLRKKHRKDWAEKEIELRRKYDEQYSDARYREMLLTKEMKEIEFSRGVESGEVFGKTWKEHKAAKKEMERTYTEKLKENEKKLEESEATIAKLRQELAEKETAVEALQKAIGRRADQVSTEEPQKPEQSQQSQQIQQFQQFQQFQQSQYPQYQLNPNTQGQGFSSMPQNFFQQPGQPSLPAFQYSLQQQQQQPQVLDQSMALVRAGAFVNTNNPGASMHPPFAVPSAIAPAFNSVPGPSLNSSRGVDQGQQHGKRVENRQQDQSRNHRDGSRDSQGNDRYRKANERSRGNNSGRDRHSDHGGSGKGYTSQTEKHHASSHLQVPTQDRASGSRGHPRNRLDDRHDTNPSFRLDVRPDIISLDHSSASNSGNYYPRTGSEPTDLHKTAVGNAASKYVYPSEHPTTASWNDAFLTPQDRNVATKGPSVPPQLPPITIESAVSRQPHSTTRGPVPTSGLKGPFGAQSQVTASSFGAVAESPSRLGIANNSPWKHDSDKAIPFHVNAQEVSPGEIMQADPRSTETSSGILKTSNGLKPSGLRTMSFEGGQKRSHSVSPPSRRVSLRMSKPQHEDEEESVQQLHLSEDEVDTFAPVVMRKPDQKELHPLSSNTKSLKKGKNKNKAVITSGGSSAAENEHRPANAAIGEEELNQAIEDARAEYTKPNADPKGEDDLVSEIDLTTHEEDIAESLINASSSKQRVLCVTLKQGVMWTGPEYTMNKIRGGALETVHVYEKDREVFVSYIDPDAAQKFHDFFNQEPDAKEAFIRFKLFVRWASDSITPISREIAFSVASGATRCLKIFQIPNDKSPEDIKTDFSTRKGSFEVLSVHLGAEKTRRKENGGMGKHATIEFFTIQLALDIKARVESGEMTGYQDCDVMFADDPCEKKDGSHWPMDSMRTWPIG